jgi:ADP-ribose pyrophosphatase YjhB (NUDIX family)
MNIQKNILHCKKCGAQVIYRLPDDGDTKERAVCTVCQTIHYENPLNVVGTLPIWEDKILLCKRNIEPRFGKWTLPAGFMELGESTEEGAARETSEEAGAVFTMGPLFSVISVPRVGQVHLFYLATLESDRFSPGPETQEAKLFTAETIPWEDLAFRTVKETLELYLAERSAQTGKVHNFVIR